MKNKKSLIVQWFNSLIISTLLISCTPIIEKNYDFPPGKMKEIPFTDNYMYMTDSCIVVFNNKTGAIVNKIYKYCNCNSVSNGR